MFRDGIRAIRELTDFWEYSITNGAIQNAKKSMKAALQLWNEKHIGFNYTVKPKVGDFYWIEYGNNLDPEMSYEHLGLVIKVTNNSLYSIPITTPKLNNRFHTNAYHSVDNPKGNNLFVKLKKSDFPFLAHDSLAKVSEVKVISKKRLRNIVYHMDIKDPLIHEIIAFAHKNIFDDFDYDINVLKKENSSLKMKLELCKFPNEIEDEGKLNNISIDESFNKEIVVDDDTITITLTDSYDQTENKVVNIIK